MRVVGHSRKWRTQWARVKGAQVGANISLLLWMSLGTKPTMVEGLVSVCKLALYPSALLPDGWNGHFRLAIFPQFHMTLPNFVLAQLWLCVYIIFTPKILIETLFYFEQMKWESTNVHDGGSSKDKDAWRPDKYLSCKSPSHGSSHRMAHWLL